MKHKKNELKTKVPRRVTIDDENYLMFKDVLYNVILSQIRQQQDTDFSDMGKKVDSIKTKPMSAKHKKRIQKQILKASGLR